MIHICFMDRHLSCRSAGKPPTILATHVLIDTSVDWHDYVQPVFVSLTENKLSKTPVTTEIPQYIPRSRQSAMTLLSRVILNH